MRFENCGAQNEWEVLHQAKVNIWQALDDAEWQHKDRKVINDLDHAYIIDSDKYYAYFLTQPYKEWENTPSGAKFLTEKYHCAYKSFSYKQYLS